MVCCFEKDNMPTQPTRKPGWNQDIFFTWLVENKGTPKKAKKQKGEPILGKEMRLEASGQGAGSAETGARKTSTPWRIILTLDS